MTERRTRLLLLLVLGVQLFLLTRQVDERAGAGGGLEALGLGTLGPLARAVDASAEGAAELGRSLRTRAALERENEELRRELERLRIERMRLHDTEDEARRLAAALDYRRTSDEEFHVADVVVLDPASPLRSLILRSPGAAPRPNQAVVATGGLVGRVIAAFGAYAKVQLLSDRAAAAGAMLERTRRQGLVRGDGQGGLLLEGVPAQADVVAGDRVVTSGIDGVYPRGIPIGTVVAVEPGAQGTLRIRLELAVDLGRLGSAYILLRPPLPDALREAGE